MKRYNIYDDESQIPYCDEVNQVFNGNRSKEHPDEDAALSEAETSECHPNQQITKTVFVFKTSLSQHNTISQLNFVLTQVFQF